MGLKLMYITNEPEVARIAEKAGVDRIFIDMEYIGKSKRQGGMDTVQSHHTIRDVKKIKDSVCSAEVLVRVNPIHDATDKYCSSKEEIDGAVNAGADIIMLPFFKTVQEVECFIKLIAGRVRTMLLVETPEAVAAIDDILKLKGIDGVHIGLNDLSLGYGKKFMFELLADGTVEKLCFKFRRCGIDYGFGGIASLGKGMLPAEYIIKEHYRLGSMCTILSRSFCDLSKIDDLKQIEDIFNIGIQKIRKLERQCVEHAFDSSYFEDNRKAVAEKVHMICGI